MALYARRRRGTTPGFWRGYNSAQTFLAERAMKSIHPGFRKKASAEVACSFVATGLPKRLSASRLASSGDIPKAMLSSTRISVCDLSSPSIS